MWMSWIPLFAPRPRNAARSVLADRTASWQTRIRVGELQPNVGSRLTTTALNLAEVSGGILLVPFNLHSILHRDRVPPVAQRKRDGRDLVKTHAPFSMVFR
jgi:hypothetical protein